MAETLSATTSTAAPQEGGLKKTLKLLYVYTLATGAIFTFMCYWDGIFMSCCGPATFGAAIVRRRMSGC